MYLFVWILKEGFLDCLIVTFAMKDGIFKDEENCHRKHIPLFPDKKSLPSTTMWITQKSEPR